MFVHRLAFSCDTAVLQPAVSHFVSSPGLGKSCCVFEGKLLYYISISLSLRVNKGEFRDE